MKKSWRYRLAYLVGWLARVKLRLRIDNPEVLDLLSGKGIIVVAHHRHPLDPFIIGSSIFHQLMVRWFAIHTLLTGEWVEKYGELQGYPKWFSKLLGKFSAWLIRGCEVVQVKLPLENHSIENGQVVRKAARELKQGQSFGIFPEGRINDGEPLEFMGGLALLARLSEASVLLVKIDWQERQIRFVGVVKHPGNRKSDDSFSQEIREKLS